MKNIKNNFPAFISIVLILILVTLFTIAIMIFSIGIRIDSLIDIGELKNCDQTCVLPMHSYCGNTEDIVQEPVYSEHFCEDCIDSSCLENNIENMPYLIPNKIETQNIPYYVDNNYDFINLSEST